MGYTVTHVRSKEKSFVWVFPTTETAIHWKLWLWYLLALESVRVEYLSDIQLITDESNCMHGNSKDIIIINNWVD